MRISFIRHNAQLCLAFALLLTPVAAQDERETPPARLKGGIVQQLRSLSAEALENLRHAERHSTALDSKPAAPVRPQVVSVGGQQLGPIPHAQYGPRSAPLPERSGTGRSAASRHAPRADSMSPPQPREFAELYGEVHVETELPATVRHSYQDVRDSQELNKPAADSTAAASQPPATPTPGNPMLRETQTLPSSTQNPNPPVAQVPQVARIPLPGAMPTSPKNATPVPNKVAAEDTATQAMRPNPAAIPSGQPSSGKTSKDSLRAVPNAMSTAMPNVRRAPVAPLQRSATLTANRHSPLNTAPHSTSSVPTTMVSSATPEWVETSDDSNRIELPEFDVPQFDVPGPSGADAGDAPQLAVPELPELQSSSLTPTLATPTARAVDTPTPAVQVPVSPIPVSKAHDSRHMKSQSPHIEVVLNGPANLAVDTPANYQVVVSNRDDFNLAGLVLRLDVPAGVKADAQVPSHGEIEAERGGDNSTLLTWVFDNLPAGQTATVPIELLTNSPRNFGVGIEWTLMPVVEAVEIGVLSPQLEVLLEGPAEVNFGEANTYRLRIRNPGNAPATQVGVMLSAEPYGSSSTEIGSIAAGGEETVDVELTFKQKGSIGISATASATGDLTSATQIEVLVRQPVLVARIDAPSRVYHGTAADYRVNISNTGDADAHDVTAVIALPPAAQLTQVPQGGTLVDDKLTWPISSLAAGMSTDINLQLSLASEGANQLKLDCSTATGVAASCSAMTDVEAVVDLKLLVNDPIAPAPVANEVLYELRLTNRGSKAAKDVRVVAQFSDGIEPVRGEGHACQVIPGQLLFDAIPTIAAGQSIALKVYAKAEREGAHRFRAEVKSAATDLRLVHEESTQYLDTAFRVATPPSNRSLR